MAQDQSVVPEGRCGFEMLAGDVQLRYLPPDTLSEAIEQNRNAICWRQTTDERDRCNLHTKEVNTKEDQAVGGGSVTVLDGANIEKLSIKESIERVICRYGDLPKAHLSCVDLSEANFSFTVLSEADFSEANILDFNLKESSLENANFSSADLSNTLFNGANLSGSDLLYANLSSSVFKDTDLSHADLSNASFKDADLSSANLSNAFLQKANLSQATLSSADLSNTRLNNANLSEAVLNDAKLFEAKIKHADLLRAKLKYANLSSVDLSDADLSGAELSSAKLSSANLKDTKIINASLTGADLTNADLTRADLSETNIKGADLPEANLSNAEIRGANLSNVDLTGVDLTNAVLSEAYLTDADLSEADFTDADLSGASLTDVNLSESDIDKANFSEADLNKVDLSERDFTGVGLLGVNLSNSIAKNADFREVKFENLDENHEPANLENVVFRDTDLRSVSFTDARLDQIDLTDARIDAKTSFDAETIYEDDDGVTSDQREGKGDTAPPSVWVHRQLEQLHEENALSSIARLFHIRKQRARKRHYAAEANVGSWRELIPDHSLDGDTLQTQIGTLRDRLTREAITSRAGDIRDRLTREEIRDRLQNAGGRLTRLGRRLRGNPVRKLGQWVRGRRDWQAYVRWLQLRTFEVTMGYGERPSRVIGMAAACVIGCALLYPLGNWVVPNPGSVEAAQRGLKSDASGDTAVDAAVRYPSLPNNLATIPSYLDSLASTLADSIYFSTVTFTTLGFGDFSPVGFGRVLATVESALGVTLFAVLVFVLGRRATR